MFTLVTFIPIAHTEKVLEAIFSAGAGKQGNYEHSCFVVRGEGRFRPLADAQPFVGVINQDEHVIEDRIECLVTEEYIEAVLNALRVAHPYEEPAIYVYKLDPRCGNK
ncbi:MAG: NGG1p interacting factor NIF3 [Deltaproteobacteria bacterium]|nr:NGG1p interacting factor NIF3 [Deltaproteobacteria bacterium]